MAALLALWPVCRATESGPRQPPDLPPLEAAYFPQTNSLDQALAFRGGPGYRAQYPLVEMDPGRLVLERVYPPISGQEPETEQTPAGGDAPPSPVPLGHEILHSLQAGGATFYVTTDKTDFWVFDSSPVQRSHRIECDLRFHGVSNIYRRVSAAWARGKHLGVAYSFGNSRRIEGVLLDLSLNKVEEWSFVPDPRGPSVANRAHILHFVAKDEDYLLALRADGGLWVMRARTGQVVSALDIGVNQSHATGVQLFWYPRSLTFAVALLEHDQRRACLAAGEVDVTGERPTLRLTSRVGPREGAAVRLFTAALGDPDHGQGAQVAVMEERLYVYRPQEGWKEMTGAPLPLDVGRLGDHEFAVRLPGGDLEVWMVSPEAEGGFQRRKLDPASDAGDWLLPFRPHLRDGYNLRVLVESHFLPWRGGLALVRRGPQAFRLDRGSSGLVPEPEALKSARTQTSYLPASLRFHPASGWWWLAQRREDLVLADATVPTDLTLSLFNLRQGRAREVMREVQRQASFHDSLDNLNNMAMGMVIVGDSATATICFASEQGLYLVDSQTGESRRMEAFFPLRPMDSGWARCLRPIFSQAAGEEPRPEYLVLMDNTWQSGDEARTHVRMFDMQGRLRREMTTPFPLWTPVFRDVNGDGFPDLVAKSTGRVAKVDLLAGKVISLDKVDGTCYAGAPMDMDEGDFLFLGDNTPTLWSAQGDLRWVGALSSDYLNRLGALVERDGARYFWQPATTGDYVVLDAQGQVRLQGETGFSDLGRHGLSFRLGGQEGERDLGVTLGARQGKQWLFGLDPMTGREAFALEIPGVTRSEIWESMPLVLRVDGSPAIWFLGERGLYRAGEPARPKDGAQGQEASPR